VTADLKQDKPPSSEIAPNAGPIVHPHTPPIDPWDLVFETNAGLTTSDNQLLGAEFAGDYFFVTGGNSALDPNIVYRLDADGTYDMQFEQWSSAGWGWRDLVYDATYLYGSDDNVVDAFDLDGNPVPEMNITTTIDICRGLAYDPVTDHFWTQSFGNLLYEFDRDGNTVWSGVSGATAVYGLAWDDGASDGPWLWMFDQTGTPQTTFYQYDPIDHYLTGYSYTLPLLPTSTAQIAGGAFFTNDWTSMYTLGGLTQGTPDDMLFILEMYCIPPALVPAAVTNFQAVPHPMGELAIGLSWDLPTTTVSGDPISWYPITSLLLDRNGIPLATLPPEASEYTDEYVPEVGYYTYTVSCVNSYGVGIPANQGAWAGLDVPAAVENLVGSSIGMSLQAELTWENPTSGEHGGYFPPGSIDGYIINRYGPVSETYDITGMTTTFTDYNIPVPGWYEYGVIPYNSSGQGPETITGPSYVGPALYDVIPYDWIEINPSHPDYDYLGMNTGIVSDDQNIGPFNIGFSYPFFGGEVYTQIRVCSNGFASFTSTATTYTNTSIPNPAEPNALVAPYWDDLNPSTTSGQGSVWYYSDPAGDFFVIEWDSLAHYDSSVLGDYFTFEMILYPVGDIDFMYKAIEPGSLSPFPSTTVGWENSDGSDGVQVTYNGTGIVEPESEMGIRLFVVSVPPSMLTMTPINPPIVIPAAGGSFDFNIEIENYEVTPLTADFWIRCRLPNGQWFGPVLGPVNFTIPAGFTISRDRTQVVPAGAPPGSYQYQGIIGEYPGQAYETDEFSFEKEMGDAITGSGDWQNFGESFDTWLTPQSSSSGLPETYRLNPAYPNPFNPSTTISYSLPEAAKVTLRVYDLQGRMVAELVNGYRDAGVHQTVFDGTGLASGVYIYSLHAGDFSTNGKMIMMK